MNANTRFFSKKVCIGLALLFATMATFGVVWAKTEKSPKNKISIQTTAGKYNKISEDDWQSLSEASQRLIGHVAKADILVGENKYKDATNQLKQAEVLSSIIDNALPKRKVVTDIREGKFVYHNEDTIMPNLIPIIDTVGISEAIKIKPEKSPTKKEKSKDEKFVERVSAAAVLHKALYFDRSSTRANLMLAKGAIKKDDAEAAHLALQNILDSIVYEESIMALPSLKISENLALAKEALKSGDKGLQESHEALLAAEQGLNVISRGSQGDRASKAKKLADQISKVEKSLDSAKVQKSLGKQVDGWLKEVAEL